MKRWWTLLAASALLTGGTLALSGPSPADRAEALLSEQLAAWQDRPSTAAGLRAYNPEWDFMWRTFFVLSLADRALALPAEAPGLLRVMDEIIADTLRAEAAHGQRWFLMAYADRAPFVHPSGRSAFVDGEVALMMAGHPGRCAPGMGLFLVATSSAPLRRPARSAGRSPLHRGGSEPASRASRPVSNRPLNSAARRTVEDEPAWREPMWERLDAFIDQVESNPALLAESYPDEVWLFCNTNALVALRLADRLDARDHGALIERWTDNAARNLREPGTGLLGSEFTHGGAMMDGPEGSSIWLVAVNLLLLDPDLARDQHERARDALVRDVAGLAYAREWPPGPAGPVDVDSGPIVPVLGASPSSSGFAFLAARAFGDAETEAALLRSLRAADLAVKLDPRLDALADNAVGSAVVLHALTFGPLWATVAKQ